MRHLHKNMSGYVMCIWAGMRIKMTRIIKVESRKGGNSEMKFKKLIAALSTVTMLGTLAMSVPVSAKAVSGDTGAVAATVSAQVRANDSAFTDRNRVEIKTGASGGIEMTQKSGVYFGAYYSFKKLDIPEGAKIDSATLTITKYDAFTDRKFNVIALNVTDAESTNGDYI